MCFNTTCVVLRVGSGTESPVFARAVEVRLPHGGDPDVRFALYDADQDDRIVDEELVGEATVRGSRLAALAQAGSGSGPITLPLTKAGLPVLDAFITVAHAGAGTDADTGAGPVSEAKRGA